VAKLGFRVAGADRARDHSSYPYYERLREDARSLAGVAGYTFDNVIVGRGPSAARTWATLVTGGYWSTLGVRPALGRFMTDAEAHPATGSRVIVLEHDYWRRRFGGDPAVVGTTVAMNGLPYEVIGVAPDGFRGVELGSEVWLPLFAMDDDANGRKHTTHESAGSFNLSFVVRPRTDVAPTRVTQELERALVRMHELDAVGREQPREASEQWTVSLWPLTGALGGDGERIPEATVVVWLVGVAGVLLVIAAANVATLLLLRAMRRRREIAVRLALGMSRGRLAGLFLVESALLALMGGTAATVAVMWGGAWIRRTLLVGSMVGERPGIDWPLLVATTITVVVVTLATGLVPALQVRGDVVAGLRDGAQHGATRRSRMHRGLLVAQTALSTMLLVGAGLFVVSLHRVRTLDLGLEPNHAWLALIDWSGSTRTPREIAAFHERALERVRAIPGVTHAGIASNAPLRSIQAAGISTTPNGQPVLLPGGGASYVNYVSDGFLEATGMRMAAGRSFTAADRTGPPTIILNETLARMAWPGRSPIGECAYFDAGSRCSRVVGVVRNARTFRIKEDMAEWPWLYVPLAPTKLEDRVLEVRVAPGIRGIEATLQRTLRELDPDLPYVDVQRLAHNLDPQMQPWRLGARAFTAFGLLAALIAAVGLYTAVAYAVTQRTREIGVRLALGAMAGAVVRLVLGDGVRIALAGVALGLLGALAGGRWIAALLFDTSPRDPLVLGGVAMVLVLVAIAASAAPTRRAVRVNPMQALRSD
jgi:predicted permease